MKPSGRRELPQVGQAGLDDLAGGVGDRRFPVAEKLGDERECPFDRHVASVALAPVLVDYPPPEAGLFVLRPPRRSPPRNVRALMDILLERFG